MTYGRDVSFLYHELHGIDTPCRVVLVTLCIVVVHILSLGPVSSERHKCSLRNLSVLALPRLDILSACSIVLVCRSLIHYVNYAKRHDQLLGSDRIERPSALYKVARRIHVSSVLTYERICIGIEAMLFVIVERIVDHIRKT